MPGPIINESGGTNVHAYEPTPILLLIIWVESFEGKARLVKGDVTLVGAVYELATGRVRFLD